MSESVKIGGIGKNPAIDKINSLDSRKLKVAAILKMEEHIFSQNISATQKAVPIDFSRVNWGGRK